MDETIENLKSKDEHVETNLINDIFSCEFTKPSSMSQLYAKNLQKLQMFALSNANLMRYCMQTGLDIQICLRPNILG